ncbi:MAG TPA: hypothetical protein VNI01_09610, partial [Elusimicrobiota bacterium]|nr:hypothetical protein [Elusimicrobiota bacterium]
QYLYDLGPLSALDHAALYDHSAWRMRVLPLGAGRLLWLGIDYARRPAASFLAWGTCVELRAARGDFSDRELLSLAKGMRPAARSLAEAERPFALRSYWARHPRPDLNLPVGPYRPPSSLWRLRWPWARAAHRVSARPAGDREWLRAVRALAPAWRFDGQFAFGPARRPLELQAVFRPARGPAHQRLWLRRLDAARSPLARPAADRLPALESYSGFSSFPVAAAAPAAGTPVVYAASVSRELGPHDVLWWEGKSAWLLQASSRGNFGLAAALGLASKILRRPLRLEGAGPGAARPKDART